LLNTNNKFPWRDTPPHPESTFSIFKNQ
jgi:hypothetical protein